MSAAERLLPTHDVGHSCRLSCVFRDSFTKNAIAGSATTVVAIP
jgi:hypothetical protein